MDKWVSDCGMATLYLGDCRDILSRIEEKTISAVISDPPYPEIDRDYGRMSEIDWHAMMDVVVSETRRVLTPQGSAVFILQPNSEYVGRMRSWLWEFMAKWSREWNMPQDAWWWNNAAPPTVHCHEVNGLMRPSTKACIWLGSSDCLRNQGDVLVPPSESTIREASRSNDLVVHPGGLSMRRQRCNQRAVDRGGATPFNMLPIPNTDSQKSAGAHGHGAGTPMLLAQWWIRYISRPDDLVADWFCGSGTMALAAIRLGRRFVGIEKMPKYFETSVARCKAELAKTSLLDGVTTVNTIPPAPQQATIFAEESL